MATTQTTTSSTRIELFTAAELSARPALLHTLVELVNLTFSGRDGFPKPRFFSDDELPESLGEQGICAVMFDEMTDEPIATASTKPWGTDSSGQLTKADKQARTDFEISAVAALAAHRGKGFADQCVRAAELATVARDGGGAAAGKKELTLWLKTVEHHNRAYWTKRGFQIVDSRVGPKGMWGAEQDFVLITMKRPAVAGV